MARKLLQLEEFAPGDSLKDRAWFTKRRRGPRRCICREAGEVLVFEGGELRSRVGRLVEFEFFGGGGDGFAHLGSRVVAGVG